MSVPPWIGRFKIVEPLGRGGFAEVFLAEDTQLGGHVAIKVLMSRTEDDPELHERFLGEARRLRLAESDRVVRVYDIGELEDGRPYLVMEYANAGTLEERLTPRPDLSAALPDPAMALRYGAEIALGVEALHRVSVAHRDIKPSNVLFHVSPSAGERILIADLGVSKDLTDTRGYTRGAGTAGYMAPEQGIGVGVTERVDFYGIGAVVYRALTGQVPPTGTRPAPPSRLRPGLPQGTDRVLLRALAADPRDRQASAAELAQAFDTLARAAGGPRRPPLRRRWALVATATLALASIAVGVVVALRDNDAGMEVASGHVVVLDSVTGVEMHEPKDGRLRNAETAVTVTGVGIDDTVTVDGQVYRAGEDHTLLVFGLSRDTETPKDGPGSEVEAYLLVGETKVDMPGYKSLQAGAHPHYLVSAPGSTPDVRLVLEHPRLTQTFDLGRGRRVETNPDILYRFKHQASWYDMNLNAPGPLQLTTADQNVSAEVDVVVGTGLLTYFGPDGETPTGTDRALLAFSVTNRAAAGNDQLVSCDLLPPAFTVHRPDGSTFQADPKLSTVRSGEGATTVWFEVPANIRHVRLRAIANDITCQSGRGTKKWSTKLRAMIDMALPVY